MLRIVQTEIASQIKRTAAVIQATIIRRWWSGTVVVVVVVVVTASTMGEAIAGGRAGGLCAGSGVVRRSNTVRDSDKISGTEARSRSRAAANFAVSSRRVLPVSIPAARSVASCGKILVHRAHPVGAVRAREARLVGPERFVSSASSLSASAARASGSATLAAATSVKRRCSSSTLSCRRSSDCRANTRPNSLSARLIEAVMRLSIASRRSWYCCSTERR